MKTRSLLGILSATAATAATLVAASALAVPPKKPPPKKDDPAAVAHKKFTDAVKEGSDKYVAKDVTGAIEAFHKAVELEPRNPFGYYLLGEAEVGNKDLAQAESAWLHASQVSDEGPPALKLKIFFVIADLRERQKRWDDAKASWEQYGDLCAKYPDAHAFPGVVKERIGMIDAMVNQDKAYEIVRKRIAEEKAHPPAGASGPPKP
jgi:tetratricopeptide (TPR) repeat protein